MTHPALADRIDAALPQTQCTRCGYPDCRGYAQAIASGEAAINRCPPGGAEGIERLAAIVGGPALALDPSCGTEGPLRRARIDEAWCIGCTLCIDACPVDCIVGAAKQMHSVIAELCTGCELCLPACPVDCIDLVNTSGQRSGWAAWSQPEADRARARYRAREQRRHPAPPAVQASASATAAVDATATSDIEIGTGTVPAERKRAAVEAALARARAARHPR